MRNHKPEVKRGANPSCGSSTSLIAPRNTKPKAPGFHISTNQTHTNTEQSVKSTMRNSRGCRRQPQGHAHRRHLSCQFSFNLVLYCGPGTWGHPRPNLRNPRMNLSQDFKTQGQKWCFSDGFQMEGGFSESSPCPPMAFLMGNKTFDFLLIDLSFYVKYLLLLTHGTSISKPLKSNFPHCAPKR